MGFRRFVPRVLASFLALAGLASCRGEAPGPGVIRGKAVDPAVVEARAARQREVSIPHRDDPDRQILFGDLHVHTTWSADAFMMSLPLMQGEGVHPVADACDFARYCSALDFWSVTDHAESLTPKRWRETIDTVRRCQAVAGDHGAPDLISFLGWEWTQIGLTAEEHYGHRNVVLRDLEDGRIPARPVAASAFTGRVMRDKLPWALRYMVPLIEWEDRDRYLDFMEYWRETREADDCPTKVHVKDVTKDCIDYAKTPSELFEALDQWDVESLVIPHGTTWGMYTPPGYFLDKSLRGKQNDEDRQRLIEVFSGHGNSEEYRDWREAEVDPQGLLICPEATSEYEPCCWRAGEIIRSRCEDSESPECHARVEEARRNYLAAGPSGHLTVPGADVEAWGACGQCLDCFSPSFSYRPGGSVQYALALTDFSDPEQLRRFHFGFLASSDNHSARPGTGYKEFARQRMTEAYGPKSSFWSDQVRPLGDPEPESEAVDPKNNRFERFQLLDFERGSSFFYTGGLVAVHAQRRDRDAVWEALKRREVYGTSGDRILLWFDLLRDGKPVAAMGAKLDWSRSPRFRVRAVGAFEQKAGCPDFAAEALGAERLEALCAGECFNPGETRRAITRIEVVRIRPQVRPGEPIGSLVEDPWKTLECKAGAGACVVEFDDPDFEAGRRDVTYYVRAIQEPTPAVNADGLRCRPTETSPATEQRAREERRGQGEQDVQDAQDASASGGDRCAGVAPCYGDWRTPYEEDCLAENEERAWSSPIYLAWSAGADESRSSSDR